MPKAMLPGVNLYYEVHGSGYPLVLLRGLARLSGFGPVDNFFPMVSQGNSRGGVPEGAKTGCSEDLPSFQDC
jgi:hypothetical protein